VSFDNSWREKAPFKKVFNDYKTGIKKEEYRISSMICKSCPIKRQCLGKTVKHTEAITTYYLPKSSATAKRI